MIPLSLTAQEKRHLYAALRARQRTIRCGLRIHDLDGRVLWNLADELISGEVVQADPSQTGPARALSVQVYDWRRKFGADMDPTFTSAASPAGYLASASYGIATASGWVDVPVFYGPLVGTTRDGATLTIEAHSLERLMATPSYRRVTVPKGTTKVAAIRKILGDCCGQRAYRLAASTARLKDPVVAGGRGGATPWLAAARIAWSLGAVLFTDAQGYVVMRRLGQTPWTFTESSIVTPPRVAVDGFDFANVVSVRGATKGKTTITATKHLPGSHSLSSTQLSRGGVSRGIPIWIEDDSITTQADADELAQETLDAHTKAPATVEAAVMVQPMLERYDMVDFPDAPPTRFRSGVIPLGTGAMTVGSTRRLHTRRPRRVKR